MPIQSDEENGIDESDCHFTVVGHGDGQGAKKTRTKKRASQEKESLSSKKKKKLVDVLQDASFLAHIALYLKKEEDLVSVEEKMVEELDKLDFPGAPKIFNKVLLGMNISFSLSSFCPIFKHDSDLDILWNYATQPSSEALEKLVQHYQLTSDTKSTILRALDPPSLKVYHQETELQLTTTHFCSLFELTAVYSGDLLVNSNKQIPDLLNKSILPYELTQSLTEFQVDAVLVQQLNHTHFLKIVREDKRDRFENHFSHPDFVRVIFIMRLALSRNVIELVKRELNPAIHNNLFVLGMTTDRDVTNLYCLKATIDENMSISYSLFFMGSYRHNQLRERAKLVDYIFQSFSIPDPSLVEGYLQTYLPSTTVPSTVEKQLDTTVVITKGLKFSYTSKSNEMKSNTTKSLWKGIIKNSLSKTWDVYCKKTESTSDSIIGTIPFLTLYVNTLPTTGEILTLAGEPVRKLLDKSEITRFAIDLLAQLVLLEDSHCIHNDIKPKNIVKYDGHYFIIDYGLALMYDTFDGTKCSNPNGILKSKSGTHPYDSPEKKDQGIVSPKSDIYSLGFSIKELVKDYDKYEWLKQLVELMEKPAVKERTLALDCIKILSGKQNEFTPLIKETLKYFKKKNYFLDEINYNNVEESTWKEFLI